MFLKKKRALKIPGNFQVPIRQGVELFWGGGIPP
jgi:hypothetical protein